MPTLSDVQQHKQAVSDLVDLARRDLREFWRSLGVDDPRVIASLVREFVPELTAVYAEATSALAADWFDDLRAEAAVAGSFVASVLDAPDVDEVQEAIGYALVPLFASEPVTDPSGDTLTRLATLTESIVTAADRQTTRANVARDKTGPRYARHASANACAFCRLLATRGGDYRSEESATRVVLQRKRSKRKLGEKYHDSCRCTAVPVWDVRTYEEAPYVEDWREAYEAAAERHGRSNTKAILADMRESMGLSH